MRGAVGSGLCLQRVGYIVIFFSLYYTYVLNSGPRREAFLVT